MTVLRLIPRSTRPTSISARRAGQRRRSFSSTSFCLCPVRSVNGRRVGDGTIPGPVTQELLTAYSELVGLDIVAQYLAHLEATDR